MDLSQKESLCEDMSEIKKCCSVCKTTKTPLWRGGPAGPKSLCNACGIKYRKRRAMVGLNKGADKKKERAQTTITTATAASASVDRGLSESLKMGLVAFGKEFVLLQRQRSSTVKRQRRRQMGEEEQAAVLLMALSCGSVFA